MHYNQLAFKSTDLTYRTKAITMDSSDRNAPLLGAANGSAPACAFRPGGKKGVDDGQVDRPSVLASIATLFLTLPALAGSCCWPLLLAGIIGISATAASRNISHTFSLALTLATLTNLVQFMWHKASAQGGVLSHWQRYGPTYVLSIATPLVLADQVRHCLQDSGVWPQPGSSMFIDSDDCQDVSGFKGMWCLTAVGWWFSIVFTYSGFSLLIVSVVWSTKLVSKIRRAWVGDDCGCDV